MGPVVKQEDLQRIVDQINGRFEWFTKYCKELEDKITELENAKKQPAAAKEKAA